jgi:AcrR family transcriptional regulator
MRERRQKVTDDEIFAAAQRAMTRRGPHELTLAHIAGEAGVSPGRLVQRFGSKRALLLALAERFAGSAGTVFAGLRAAHRRPLATLRAYAQCMAGLAATPDTLSRNLAYLQIDLTDPEFRAHLQANARATRLEIASLLRAAVAEGVVRGDVDAPRLARTIEAVINGSLMTWACYREGPAAAWIRRDLEAVLQPHLAVGAEGKAPASGRFSRRQARRRPGPRGE